MPFALRMLSFSLALSLSLICAVFSPAQSSSAPPTVARSQAETELRAVVEKYFALYAGKDLDGLMNLWSAKIPDSAGKRKAIGRQLETSDVSISGLTISRVKIEGERAGLRCALDVITTNKQNRKTAPERQASNFQLVREDGMWKLWEITAAVNDLAAALERAASEQEQEQLLAQEIDLVDSSLVAALEELTVPRMRKGDYAQALRISQLAARIAERIGDRLGLGHALSDLGMIYNRQGRAAQALDYARKSLAIFEEAGDKKGKSRAMLIMGNAHCNLGRVELGLELYHKSRAISEELNDKVRIEQALSNIGSEYIDQGRYAEGLEYLQKSLRIIEEIGSDADKSSLATNLLNIGLVYRRQGRPDQALAYYHRSLKLMEESGDKLGIANLQNNIGVAYKSQGLYEQAIEWFQKSLQRYEGLQLKGGVARSLNNIGDTYRLRERHDQALEHLRKSHRLREENNDRAGISLTLNNLGRLYQDQGRHAEMLEVSRRAAGLAEEINDPEALWNAQELIGGALLALGRPVEARRNFLAAIATIESLRHKVAGGQQRQSFLENRLAPWLGMIALLVSQREYAEALSFAERSKARVLLDALQAGRASLRKSLSPQERQSEEEQRLRLVSLNSQLTREARRDKPDSSRVAELKASIEKTRLEYEAVEASLYAAHPELKAHRGEASIIKAEELKALLPDATSALLEYVVADDQTYLFAITKAAGQAEAETQVYTIPIKRSELAKQTESFRAQLAGRDLGFRASAHKLYDLLLKPAQGLLQGKSSLVIAPDDKLWELPFQALLTPDGRYMIETCAVSYAPSLTVLREMKAQRGKHRAGRRAETAGYPLLALGNPAIGKETIERAALLVRAEKLDPLPDAEQEVKALGQLYGSARSKVYIGPEAREDRLKAEATQARVLHFATHGILNNASPMYSHLVLAQGDKSEDGLFEAWELMQLDLKADLAVLSACETARGRFGAGEGVIGLTWAMFIAGVPSTVVSQWKVESASTRDLMLNFHRALGPTTGTKKANVTKAEALRQAALKLMKNPETNHPFYWAGFVLVGDGR